jgi:UDP-GlcNAc:undecaprenyl-phosphate/decaprenyl-phosphate GlcNAc-1-phosphate transferase
VTIAAALLSLPVCALTLALVLRTPAAQWIVSAPRPDRWKSTATPLIGGIGIFAGIVVGTLVSVRLGILQMPLRPIVGDFRQVLGVLGGCSILFVFGLLDDAFHLPPVAKLAGQFGAAALVVWTGTETAFVHNYWLKIAITIVWLVGITNAFNLLDNMDGLAASLAAIAAGLFAIDAWFVHENRLALVLSLAVLGAALGFLPFNVWPRRSALAFMGDSGSQTLGFALAATGVATTSHAAETTIATLIVPLLVLAVPILDTALVMIVRLLEGRPIYQGGRDHTSHRLVVRGLSERRAVLVLAVFSFLLGATSLAYSVIHDSKLTAVGVLLTFALLVQFGSFLGDIERHPEGFANGRVPILRLFIFNSRRLIEVIVDGAVVAASFYGAYVLRLGSNGTQTQKAVFLWAFPVVLFSRYVAFIVFGLYRGVWRYAGARDAASVALAVAVSGAVAFGVVAATRPWYDFPRNIFLIDILLCTVLVGASRFWERAAQRGVLSLNSRGIRHRTLIVGAGRTGRNLLRELRDTPGERVVGFIDDDPALWRRRLQGAPVLGTADEASRIITSTSPDSVVVTIPNAPGERLDFVFDACAKAGIECRVLRQEVATLPLTVIDVDAE